MASKVNKNFNAIVAKRLWTIGSVKRIAMHFAKKRVQNIAQESRTENLGPLRVLTSIMKDKVERPSGSKPLKIELPEMDSNLLQEVIKRARTKAEEKKRPTLKVYSSKHSIISNTPTCASQRCAERRKVKHSISKYRIPSKRDVSELNLDPVKRVPDASTLLNFYLTEAWTRYKQLATKLEKEEKMVKGNTAKTMATPKVSVHNISPDSAPKPKAPTEELQRNSDNGSKKNFPVLPRFGHFAHKISKNYPCLARSGPVVSMVLKKSPTIPRSGTFTLKTHNNYTIVPHYGRVLAKVAKRVPVQRRPGPGKPKVARVPVPPHPLFIAPKVANRSPVPPRPGQVVAKVVSGKPTRQHFDPPISRLGSIATKFPRPRTVGAFVGLSKPQSRRSTANAKLDSMKMLKDKIKEHIALGSPGCVVTKASVSARSGSFRNFRKIQEKIKKSSSNGFDGGYRTDLLSEWKIPNAPKKRIMKNKRHCSPDNVGHNSQPVVQARAARTSPNFAIEQKLQSGRISDKVTQKFAVPTAPKFTLPDTFGEINKLNYWKKQNDFTVSQKSDYPSIVPQRNVPSVCPGVASQRKMASDGMGYKGTERSTSTSSLKQVRPTYTSNEKIGTNPSVRNNVGHRKTMVQGFTVGASPGKSSVRKMVSGSKEKTIPKASMKALPPTFPFAKIRTGPPGCEITKPKSMVNGHDADTGFGLTTERHITDKGTEKAAAVPMTKSGVNKKSIYRKIRTGPPGCEDASNHNTMGVGHAAGTGCAQTSERRLASQGIEDKVTIKAATLPFRITDNSKGKTYTKIRTGPPGCEVAESSTMSYDPPARAKPAKRKAVPAPTSATALLIEMNSISLADGSERHFVPTSSNWEDIPVSRHHDAVPVKVEVNDKTKITEEKKITGSRSCDRDASKVKTVKSEGIGYIEKNQASLSKFNPLPVNITKTEGSTAVTSRQPSSEQILPPQREGEAPSLVSKRHSRPTATSLVAPSCTAAPSTDVSSFSPIKYVHGKVKKIF